MGTVPVRIWTVDGIGMDQKGIMMRRSMLATASACFLANGLPHAQAQQQPGSMLQGWNSASAYYLQVQRVQQGFTPQELDRMSQQRMEERGRVDHGPPVPLSSVPGVQLFQPPEPWVCKGTADWQPIYAAPSKGSAVVGKTLDAIAVGGRNVNGFSRVLTSGGQIGYVPSNTIHEYRSDVNPGSTCSVKGVRANGAPVFAYQ